MENESCGTRCVQFVLFMLNFIFFLCGIGMVIVGIFIWTGPLPAFNYNVVDLATLLNNPYLETGCFIMVGAGAIVIFFSIIGCCGAFLLSRCLLGLYFLIIIVLFFAQLAGAVLAAIYSSEIDNFVSSQFLTALDANYKYDNSSFSNAVDLFQRKFECCGVMAKDDYNGRVPLSCCMDKEENVASACTLHYEPGCSDALKELLTTNATIIGASLVGVACLELFLMVFSVVLCRNASEKDDY